MNKPFRFQAFAIAALILILSNSFTVPIRADDPSSLASEALIVVGAGGTDEYFETFQGWADRWRLALPPSVKTTLIGVRNGASDEGSTNRSTDRQRILDWIEAEPKTSVAERWLILIGHGTYQLKVAKFNLEGPDLSSDELAKAIAASQAQWRIIICASCSGPFINALSGPNRIILTATKSGSEQNYSRFGDYLSQSISAPTSDLDHDGNVSILEAFLVASENLSNWYADEGRIASEQALIDDNGDKRGTPANFFRGVRAAKAPADGLLVDGQTANRVITNNIVKKVPLTLEQQAKVADLEQQIETLRQQKKEFAEVIYYAQLEQMLVELAQLLVPSSSDSIPRAAP